MFTTLDSTLKFKILVAMVCHRGHYVGLSRCRLVDSCVLAGENVFT